MKFYLALWASKFYLLIKKIQGKQRSDRAGLLAAKICPEILTKVKKPKLVIVVTGTNGKSTITHLIYDMLIQEGFKIGFNDWNANMRAGHIRCLIDSVNIFNKPNKDVVILEADELTSNLTFPEINPNYIIVTNLCNDSIRRNSYIEYVYSKLDEAIKNTKATTILNEDDPISSFLGDGKNTKYISVLNMNKKPYENITSDFSVCPKCNHKVEYEYRQYRHIGKFKCPNCGLTSKTGNYHVSKITKNSIILNDYEYPLLSSSIHNIYNEADVISLFKEMNYSDDKIRNLLENVSISKTREDEAFVNNHHVYARLAKAQNGSSLSTVLESLVDKNKKQIALILDEHFASNTMETITWIFDNDFELLTRMNLNKIIISGPRYLDYKLRIKLAGIDENKIEIASSYDDIVNLYDYDNEDDLYVLYDVDRRPEGKQVFDDIIKRNGGTL